MRLPRCFLLAACLLALLAPLDTSAKPPAPASAPYPVERALAAVRDDDDPLTTVAIVEANRQRILANPLPWRETVFRLIYSGDAAAVLPLWREALQRHSAAGEWPSRFALAELELQGHHRAAAERILWQLVTEPAPKRDRSTSQANTSAPTPSSSLPRLFSIDPPLEQFHSAIGTRLAAGQQAYTYLCRLMAFPLPGLRAGHIHLAPPDDPPIEDLDFLPPLPTNWQEAHDRALIYLAAFAESDDGGVAFVARLQKLLAPASHLERFTTWYLLGARELLAEEVEAELQHPSGNEDLSAWSFAFLARNRDSRSDQARSPLDFRSLRLFLKRLQTPTRRLNAQIKLLEELRAAQRFDEGEALKAEIVASAQNARPELLPSLIQFLVAEDDGEAAQRLCRRYKESLPRTISPRQTRELLALCTAVARKCFETDAMARRGAELLVDAIPLTLPPEALPEHRRLGYRAMLSELDRPQRPDFPEPGPCFSQEQLDTWFELFSSAKADELKRCLAERIATRTPTPARQFHLALACFQWWSDDGGAAVEQLKAFADKQPDAALLLLVADMHWRRNDSEAEDATLQRIRDLGLEAQARQLKKAGDLPTPLGPHAQALVEQLTEAVKQNETTKAEALARAILAEDPLPVFRSWFMGGAYVPALEFLASQHQLEPYLADLQSRVAHQPDSLRLRLQLLQAQQMHYGLMRAASAPRSAAHPGWHAERDANILKIAELRPDDGALMHHLLAVEFDHEHGTADEPANTSREALSLLELVLQHHPDLMVSGHPWHWGDWQRDLLRVAQQHGRLEQLGKALLALPPPPDFTAAELAAGEAHSSAYLFANVADALSGAGLRQLAIPLWRTALHERPNASARGKLVASLVADLLATDDNLAAVAAAQDYLFPAPPPKAVVELADGQPGQFAWGIPPDETINILRLFHDKPDARGKLHARAEAEAAGERPELGSLVVLILDCQQRDLGLLPSIESRLNALLEQGVKERSIDRLKLAFAIDDEIFRWREAHAFALDFMDRNIDAQKEIERSKRD